MLKDASFNNIRRRKFVAMTLVTLQPPEYCWMQLSFNTDLIQPVVQVLQINPVIRGEDLHALDNAVNV